MKPHLTIFKRTPLALGCIFIEQDQIARAWISWPSASGRSRKIPLSGRIVTPMAMMIFFRVKLAVFFPTLIMMIVIVNNGSNNDRRNTLQSTCFLCIFFFTWVSNRGNFSCHQGNIALCLPWRHYDVHVGSQLP